MWADNQKLKQCITRRMNSKLPMRTAFIARKPFIRARGSHRLTGNLHGEVTRTDDQQEVCLVSRDENKDKRGTE